MTSIRIERMNDGTIHLFFKGHAENIDGGEVNRACAALSLLAQTFQFELLKAEETGGMEIYECFEDENEGLLEIFAKPAEKEKNKFGYYIDFVESGIRLTDKCYPGSIRILNML